LNFGFWIEISVQSQIANRQSKIASLWRDRAGFSPASLIFALDKKQTPKIFSLKRTSLEKSNLLKFTKE
jgi:hypothetical protein